MGDYLKPLRRKIGMLTLLITLVLMAGWVRSMYRQDTLDFCPGRSIFFASSGYSHVMVSCFTFPSRDAALSQAQNQIKSLNIGWWSDVISEPLQKIEPWGNAKFESHWKLGEFICGTASFTTVNQRFDKRYVLVPYWSIVILLTLISLWLLLSKPRQLSQTIFTEPVPAG